jgi:hypothetical protein
MTVLPTSLPHIHLQILPQRGDFYSTAVKTEARRLFMHGATRDHLPALCYYEQELGRIFNNLPNDHRFRLRFDNP